MNQKFHQTKDPRYRMLNVHQSTGFIRNLLRCSNPGPFEFPAQTPCMLLISQRAPKCFKVHQSALGVLYRTQECLIVMQVCRTRKQEIQMVPDFTQRKKFLKKTVLYVKHDILLRIHKFIAKCIHTIHMCFYRTEMLESYHRDAWKS